MGPLFRRLQADLVAAGLPIEVPGYSWYVALDDESGRVEVNAAFPAGAEAALGPVADSPGGLEVVELPAIDRAAVRVHHGPPDTIGDTWAFLGEWISREGFAPVGPGREVYLSPPDVPMEDWVTEVQIPIAKA
jgi:effector-binding domain-containing protein